MRLFIAAIATLLVSWNANFCCRGADDVTINRFTMVATVGSQTPYIESPFQLVVIGNVLDPLGLTYKQCNWFVNQIWLYNLVVIDGLDYRAFDINEKVVNRCLCEDAGWRKLIADLDRLRAFKRSQFYDAKQIIIAGQKISILYSPELSFSASLEVEKQVLELVKKNGVSLAEIE